MDLIVAAKDRQAQEANKAAETLLKELEKVLLLLLLLDFSPFSPPPFLPPFIGRDIYYREMISHYYEDPLSENLCDTVHMVKESFLYEAIFKAVS